MWTKHVFRDTHTWVRHELKEGTAALSFFSTEVNLPPRGTRLVLEIDPITSGDLEQRREDSGRYSEPPERGALRYHASGVLWNRPHKACHRLGNIRDDSVTATR